MRISNLSNKNKSLSFQGIHLFKGLDEPFIKGPARRGLAEVMEAVDKKANAEGKSKKDLSLFLQNGVDKFVIVCVDDLDEMVKNKINFWTNPVVSMLKRVCPSINLGFETDKTAPVINEAVIKNLWKKIPQHEKEINQSKNPVEEIKKLYQTSLKS
ncbi:MAG TPA: hypothetical protein P5556_09160 [Candidatus Gastranaerophilales bacterium]|nr:hypothetical protein [Candidatus Gastranaerophilales bacterium]